MRSDLQSLKRLPVKRLQTEAKFSIKAGRVYELRLLLQELDTRQLCLSNAVCEVTLTFTDAQGRVLDLRLERGAPIISDLCPARFEIAPKGAFSDAGVAATEATRLLLAPPDAVHLVVDGLPENVVIFRSELCPLSVFWAGAQGRQAVIALKRLADLRLGLIEAAFGSCSERVEAWKQLAHIPVRQAEALCEYFCCGGDWAPVVARLAVEDVLDDHDLRLSRLRSQTSECPRVGFVGSQRGRERLMSMCEVVWLREAEWQDQIAFLDLDLIVIETAIASGVRGDDDDWQLAFSSLDGDMPARGSALFDAAANAGIPVHLWFTGTPDAADLWREAAQRAMQVVAEGEDFDWADLGPDHVIRRATEPASCSMAHIGNRPADLMLIPVASDVFQFPEFNDLVNQQALYATLLSEATYGFNIVALSSRLTANGPAIVIDAGRAEQRALMQSARIVLLSARSIRSDAALSQIAIDSIASGAIPVVFGTYTGRDPILSQLDVVLSSNDLAELQAFWRVSWVRQRRLRALFRYVMRHHVWQRSDRTALLGRDPFQDGFDKPRVSVVLATKRPHLVTECLATFRRQSWPNKELVLVFNTGVIPPNLPALQDNEYAYALPEAATIGECLNRGIARATGRYWAKMDDDDFYSTTYLEETIQYYRSSQADAVGRQSAGYYFAGENLFRWREYLARRCWTIVPIGRHISGATLSGDAQARLPSFSVTERNSMDSTWVQRVVRTKHRVFSGDSTSMVVYRDGDETLHTYKISAMKGVIDNFVTITDGCLSNRLDS